MTFAISKRRLLISAGATLLLVPRARAAEADVTIDNFTFNPTPLKIAAGTTVKWTNRDDIPHSILCGALQLHSHALDTDDSFSHTFEKPGTYDYICAIHPHMRGQIIVT